MRGRPHRRRLAAALLPPRPAAAVDVQHGALSIILFLYGWNQYLWPLLFSTEKDMATAVIGLKHLIPQSDAEPAWNVAMNAALLVMLPPALVVVALQRWLVKGLVDSGK